MGDGCLGGRQSWLTGWLRERRSLIGWRAGRKSWLRGRRCMIGWRASRGSRGREWKCVWHDNGCRGIRFCNGEGAGRKCDGRETVLGEKQGICGSESINVRATNLRSSCSASLCLCAQNGGIRKERKRGDSGGGSGGGGGGRLKW